MKLLRSLRGVAGLASLPALWVGTVIADDTANMSVTATVTDACQITAVDTMAFGVLDQAADNIAQANITWVCTDDFTTTIELNGGGSGNIGARAMTGAGTLPYQLYRDSGRSEVFGDGSGGSFSVDVTGSGYGNPDDVVVYGRVAQPDAAAAVAGAYTDTVLVTILF